MMRKKVIKESRNIVFVRNRFRGGKDTSNRDQLTALSSFPVLFLLFLGLIVPVF